MDLYTLFKSLHVVAAVAWVGGASLGMALGLQAARSADDDLFGALRQLKWCAERIFVPASMATLAFGLAMTWLANLWLELWVLIAFLGIAVTMTIGMAILGPRIEHALELYAEGETRAAAEIARRVLWAGGFDLTLLLIIVVDMVVRPNASDVPVLLTFAGLVLAAGFVFLPRALARDVTSEPREV